MLTSVKLVAVKTVAWTHVLLARQQQHVLTVPVMTVMIALRVHVRVKIVTTVHLATAHAVMKVHLLVRATVRTALVQIAPVEIVPAMAATNVPHAPALIVTSVPHAHVMTATNVPHVPALIATTDLLVLAMTAMTVQVAHDTRTKNDHPVAAVQTSTQTNQKRVDSLQLKMLFWSVLKPKQFWWAMLSERPSLI
jgi:hypothetical protein